MKNKQYKQSILLIISIASLAIGISMLAMKIGYNGNTSSLFDSGWKDYKGPNIILNHRTILIALSLSAVILSFILISIHIVVMILIKKEKDLHKSFKIVLVLFTFVAFALAIAAIIIQQDLRSAEWWIKHLKI